MNPTRTLSSLIAFPLLLLLASAAGAQEILSVEGVEITRDAIELQDVLSPQPDRDFVDTALVFTNQMNRPARVSCTGFGRNGQVVGHAWLWVPARGLRYVLGSDLADGRDFIGSARCWSMGRWVVGSAFLLKPFAITDLPSQPRWARHLIKAEVVEELSSAGELAAPQLSVDATTGEQKPVPLPVRLIRFPVVATY